MFSASDSFEDVIVSKLYSFVFFISIKQLSRKRLSLYSKYLKSREYFYRNY